MFLQKLDKRDSIKLTERIFNNDIVKLAIFYPLFFHRILHVQSQHRASQIKIDEIARYVHSFQEKLL